MKKRIGILGGTFNPPHLGHLIIANEVLQALQLDEVRFMPNQEPPHKKKDMWISNEDRVKLLQLSIAGHPCFTVETIELERQGRSYTYDTIVLLREREPDVEFYFIIGADMIEYLPKWYRIEELLSMVKFVGVNRPHHSQETEYPIVKVSVPDINISSTLIRTRLSENKSVKYLVLDHVCHFIKERGLYGSK
ncbi:nicotinate-nucleotide adenylyltransferase [Bacillus sp. FJAT-49736]|uniref:nicotinate-nucleotide adenylyltransferase n=1 Tax=Bacillus sp. FJAT-49736 TaxID=2833582 RepID=UPI001BCA3C72|nr:nicotinate-nucleotide adenylyltransferase [Bacillus sp. FJAT-49736]MBS4173608.1 nicotinate-nucleotide adenylyltransferase [Bacillus sp. FJAT-49736]